MLSLSVCPSVRLKPALHQNYWTNRAGSKTSSIRPVVLMRFPSNYPALCYKEIRVCTKIRVLPSKTFSHTLDLREFCHCKSILLQQNSSTIELVDSTFYDGRRAVAGRAHSYYPSVGRNAVRLTLHFTSTCCGFS